MSNILSHWQMQLDETFKLIYNGSGKTEEGRMVELALPSKEDKLQLELAITILRRYGAKAVYLFGSMATGSARPDSDWDLGVEGLPSNAYFQVLGELFDCMNRKVDLIELDDGSRFAGFLKQWENLIRVA